MLGLSSELMECFSSYLVRSVWTVSLLARSDSSDVGSIVARSTVKFAYIIKIFEYIVTMFENEIYHREI